MVDQQSIGPDDWETLEDLPLTPYELRAKAHWERFLPKTVASLRRSGPQALDLAIRKAYHQMDYQTALHMARAPELHRDQVEPLYRDLLFPPPEPAATRDAAAETTT